MRARTNATRISWPPEASWGRPAQPLPLHREDTHQVDRPSARPHPPPRQETRAELNAGSNASSGCCETSCTGHARPVRCDRPSLNDPIRPPTDDPPETAHPLGGRRPVRCPHPSPMGSPSTSTTPAFGMSWPARTRQSVDLPAPDAPRSAKRAPGARSTSTSANTAPPLRGQKQGLGRRAPTRHRPACHKRHKAPRGPIVVLMEPDPSTAQITRIRVPERLLLRLNAEADVSSTTIPCAKHRQSIGDAQREIEVMRDKQHTATVLGEGPQIARGHGCGLIIHARRWLICDEQPRLLHERAHEQHAARHAAGQFVRVHPLDFRRKPVCLEELPLRTDHPAASMCPYRAAVGPSASAAHLLANAHQWIERGDPLRNQRNPMSSQAAEIFRGDAASVEPHLATRDRVCIK